MFVGYGTKYYKDRNYAEARLSGVEPTIADERAVMDKNARALMISYISERPIGVKLVSADTEYSAVSDRIFGRIFGRISTLRKG